MIGRILDFVRVNGEAIDPRLLRRKQRMRMIGIGILIPTIIMFIYYAALARPEYQTEMKFTIQGLEQRPPDILGGIGIPAITRTSNDGLIVVEFLESRELVRRLEENYGFDAAYGNWSFDPLARISPDAPLEEKTDFWLGQSSAAYDATSNVITVHVRAYTPEESLRLTEGILVETESVVNSLNSRVQNEAVRVADEEVEMRRDDYNDARRRVIAARGSRATSIDSEASLQISLIGQIEGQLANARVERAGASAQFRPDSPQIRAFDERIAALESQRAIAIADIRGGPGQSEASLDVSGQTALLDYQFAQQAYYAAIQARQQSMSSRENERRYLVAFVPPRLPEVSNYWSRFTNVIAVAIAAALMMALAALGYSVVKDHMQ